MRELDRLLEQFLLSEYPRLGEAERRAFEELLDMQDPQIHAYLLGRDRPEGADLRRIVAAVRRQEDARGRTD